MKFIKNLLFIFLSVVIFFYAFKKSNKNIFDDYYFIYFTISLLILIFGIYFIFLKNETKNKIIIVFFSTTISLYLVEGFAGYQYSSNWTKKVKEKKNYDKRSVFDAYISYKNKYSDLKFRLGPSHFRYDNELLPLSTFSNSTIFVCNENGYYMTYKSDMYGFNNPNIEWNNKNQIMMIGDSFTEGNCVYEKYNIAGNLKQKLNTENIINLGMGGNGPLTNYATIREYFFKVNPKFVLWFHYEGNDFDDLKKELNSKILNKYLINENFTQKLALKQKEIDTKLNKYLSVNEKNISRLSEQNKFDWSRFFKLYTLREQTVHTFFTKPHEIKDEFYLIINKAKEFTEKNNAEFYFVYLPQFHRYSSFYSFQNSKNYKKTLDFLKENTINYIDINKEIIEKVEDPLELFPFRSAGHYNEKGYEFIAEAIYSNLK